MMFEKIGIVFNKEIIDNLRDRRSLTSTLMYSLLGPLMTLLIIWLVGQMLSERIEKTLEIPVDGRENAPSLIDYLRQQNVTIQPAPVDPQAAVRNGDVELVIVIPKEYGKDLTEGRPATVQIVQDSSRQSSSVSIRRTERLLEAYNRQLGAMRLMVRGISPSVVDAVTIEAVDVSTPQSQALLFLNILPYFLIMALFLGGSAVIIDATAGEREHASLEPLLINPIPRRDLVIGKLLATFPFVVGSLVIALIGFGIILNVVPVEEFIGFRLSVDPLALGGVFLICLPMLLFASALQMIIATFTHTYKEAQTYVNWLPLIPALPGLGLAFVPVKPELWTMLIPTFGQQILINQVMRGEPISLANIVVSATVTLLAGLILILVAIRMYQREQLLFGKK
ncbi:MAG: ABC transporter permease [Chloroflexi bacterium]|nr:ABC transporter permease [Chloroflexota bacterium]